MSQHFKEVCQFCDAAISQCRCPGTKTIRRGICPACKSKKAVGEVVTKEQLPFDLQEEPPL